MLHLQVLNHMNASVHKIENDGLDLVSSPDSIVDRCIVITCDDAMCAKAGGGPSGAALVLWSPSLCPPQKNRHPSSDGGALVPAHPGPAACS